MEKTEYCSLTIVRTAKILREWDLISTRIAEISSRPHRYLYLDSIVEDSLVCNICRQHEAARNVGTL